MSRNIYFHALPDGDDHHLDRLYDTATGGCACGAQMITLGRTPAPATGMLATPPPPFENHVIIGVWHERARR